MKRRLPAAAVFALLGALLAAAAPTRAAGPVEEARRLYAEFVAGQNSHDFERVKSTLLDSPRFLWVTNGLSIWGRDAAVARMADYHTAEIWRITPDEARAVAVEVAPDAAFLHLPLDLEIGSATDGPDRFRFLVSALCVATPQGWRFAALFTTTRNPEQ
jgi:ketosteroid isomerase-like protein